MTRSAPGPRAAWPGTAVFLLALAVHGVVGWQYRSDPFYETPVADALSYHERAARIAAGGLAGEGVFHQAPLFPAVLGALYAVAPPDWRAAAALGLQGLLTSAALALLVPLGRRYLGSTAAGVAAALLALGHGPLVFQGLKLLATPLGLLTQALALLALAAARGRSGPGLASAAGIAWGAAALARPEALAFAPLAALAVLPAAGSPGRRLVPPVALLAGIALGVSPATVHNLRRGDRVLVASSLGENLYVGNQRGATGGFTPIDPEAGDLFSQRLLAERLAVEARGRPLRPSEVSAYWTGRALADVRADPAGWLRLEGRKLARALDPADPSDLYSYPVERARYLWVLRLLPCGAWTVLVLAGCGLVLALRGGASRAWPLVALASLHLLLLLAFFVDTRLRLPWLFFLSPFAGLALVRGGSAWRARRHRAAIAAIAVAALAGSAVGELRMHPTPPDVVRLASLLSLRGRLDDSLAVLAPELARRDPDPLVLDQAGWVLQKKHDLTGARERYRQALAAGLPPARASQTGTRLARVLEALGDAEGARAAHDRAVATARAGGWTFLERGLFRLRHGDAAGAVADLREAAARAPGWAAPLDALRRLGIEPPVSEPRGGGPASEPVPPAGAGAPYR